jgi:hypothetical protein
VTRGSAGKGSIIARQQIVHTLAIFESEGLVWSGLENRWPGSGSIGDSPVFKLPSYDPVSIAMMGFGILLVAALALTLG